MLSTLIALLIPAAFAQTTWLTPDFKIIQTHRQNVDPIATDCRAQIAKATCLVDPIRENMQEFNPLERVCLPGSEVYAPTFESLYDRMPAHLQRMFCSLERIFIEKEFVGTAYGGLAMDSNHKVLGALMGFRKDFLDQTYTIDFWASWKDQLNFGGNPESYEVSPALPMHHSSSQDMLLYVVAHEFGHMFDFTNRINRFDDCRFENGKVEGTCTSAAGSWSALSWKNIFREATPENDFPLRKSLCFYWCEGKTIDPGQAHETYSALLNTNFISLYAASNYGDDWAELLAYHTLDRHSRATYEVVLRDGSRFDIINHLHSPLMAQKIRYLEEFFAGDVKYPGR